MSRKTYSQKEKANDNRGGKPLNETPDEQNVSKNRSEVGFRKRIFNWIGFVAVTI
jgi:hypothetical protein